VKKRSSLLFTNAQRRERNQQRTRDIARSGMLCAGLAPYVAAAFAGKKGSSSGELRPAVGNVAESR